MADVMRLVVVNGDGSEGKHLGTMLRTDRGTVITTGPNVVEDIIEGRVRMSGGLSRGDVFGKLLAEGWSNGKLMLVREGTGNGEGGQ